MTQPALSSAPLSSATPPPVRLVILAIQHVLVMYAGAVAVPLILGAALKLPRDQVVLLIILLLLRFGTGFLRNTAVLIGIVAGYFVTLALGWGGLDGLGAQPWFDIVMPFQFGILRFDLVACLSMCLVMVVVMIESTGMFLALGVMVGKPVSQDDLARGLRADGVGTLIGGIFNTFPYTSFSQNVGLVGVTGVTSPMVCVAGGAIMLLLGLLPKLAFIAASVPQCVLGGAGVVMFGMVAATGIRILATVDYEARRGNVFIVAISIGFGMIPLVAPTLFKSAPDVLKTMLDSGILLASVTAVALNAFFNPDQLADGAQAAPLVIADHA